MSMKIQFEWDLEQARGMLSALLASFFLGWAPILGKLAYEAGVRPFTLAAVRTLVAVLLLWIVYLLFLRTYLSITWRNLLGCVAVGAVNGVGSLLYYSGLLRLDASRASFLNNTISLWVVVFLTASGEPLRWLTLVRLVLAMGGVYLLTGVGGGEPDWLGGMLMLASAAAYGWHLVMGQWVLADVSSRTATLYILTAMAAVVGLARVFQGRPLEPVPVQGGQAVLALGLTTALSRILMFAGLKRLGGTETSLVGLLELLVSLVLAFILLGERLTPVQWLGGVILVTAVLLRGRKTDSSEVTPWWEQ
jgi:drug/metabolite transporter (DMT)-like permease